MKLKSKWLVKQNEKIHLTDFPTGAKDDLSPEAAAAVLAGNREQLAKLQELLYAGQKHSVLIVLQGMDTAGKDGTIAHIFSGINPQGCDVASFKTPTPVEAAHDFVWRCHAHTPARGMIVVFNRSHYEQVLFPRVHGQISKAVAHQQMAEIVDFEKLLAANNTLILKFFLHISAAEQTRRLQARLDDPAKHWKFSAADLAERKFWDDYQSAYEDAISRTSRRHAPWFVIPSDHKTARNLAISAVLVEALKGLKLTFPKPTVDVTKIKL